MGGSKYDVTIFTCIAVIGHTTALAISITLTVNTKVPYPGLFKESPGFQVFINIVTISSECAILVINLAEKMSSRIEKYRKNISRTYFLCLIGLLLFALIGIIGLLSIFGTDIRGTVEEILYKQVTEFYGMPDYADVTDAINALQREGKCCGATYYADFFNSSFASSSMFGGRVLPVTCFKIPEDGCTGPTSVDGIDYSKIYLQGCTDALTELYRTQYRMIALPALELCNACYDSRIRTQVLIKLRPDEYKVDGWFVALKVKDPNQEPVPRDGKDKPDEPAGPSESPQVGVGLLAEYDKSGKIVMDTVLYQKAGSPERSSHST